MFSEISGKRVAQGTGLGLLGLLLQQVPVSFVHQAVGNVGFDASLVHLHAGLLLAIAMLCRDRLVVALAFVLPFLGWCVRQWLAERATPWLPSLLLAGPANWLFAWWWTLACARWAGWPRDTTRDRLQRSDLGWFALYGLLLYPLGLALFGGLSVLLVRPSVAFDSGILILLAKFFGVAVVTLPLVVAWSERSRPTVPSPSGMSWWPVLLLAGVSLVVASGLWVQYRSDGEAAMVLLDYRFVLLMVLAIIILRLRPVYSMPMLSLALFGVAMLVSQSVTSNIDTDVVGIVNLLHIGLEVVVLLLSMMYLWVSSRDRCELAALVLEENLRDTVTGLPNLRALRQRVTEMQHEQHTGQLAYLVLDHSESVASGFGLDAQAAVTRTVANRISSLAGIYLVGTGQFALLCLQPTADGNWERILNRVKNARIDAGGQAVHLQPYLGVCSTPIRSVVELDAALLVVSSLAFDARSRGELVPLYSANGHPSSPDPRSRMQSVAAAFDSLRNHRLSLYFQPIVDLQQAAVTTPVIRGEVLCRLRDRNGCLMETSAFMPYIEAAGRGAELDLAVIQCLFQLLRRHPKALPACDYLGINITGQSLSLASFRSELLGLLAESPLPMRALCFEVTERASIIDIAVAGELLQQLRVMGARIAIDDFGTGMQSFDRLKQLPVDTIKIDGTFVSHMVGNSSDHAIIEASVAIARAFGASTVAEFVESRELAELLHGLGVDEGQGDYFGAPRPLQDVLSESVRQTVGAGILQR